MAAKAKVISEPRRLTKMSNICHIKVISDSDLLPQFDLNVHPFGEHVALIDDVDLNVEAIRPSKLTQHEDDCFNNESL
jgi:hypothetical protein